MAKATSSQARTEEMLQRAEFYKEQLKNAQARLQEDTRAFDERKRNMLLESDDELLRQQTELERLLREELERIQYFEKSKADLYHQYQRAVLLEQEMRLGAQDLNE